MMNSIATSPSQLDDRMVAERSRGRQLVISAVRWYQAARAGRVSPCRFYPSCSSYAIEAVELHGVGRGLLLASRRVARCRPFGSHGVDLVPLRKKDR